MRTIKLFRIVLFVLLVQSCSNNETPSDETIIPPKPENSPPEAFDLISIENDSSEVGLMPQLSWQASTDKDGDPIVYDVYLDTNSNPTTKVVADISSSSFTLTERLDRTTHYYWKVVAKDGKGLETESSNVFVFGTRYFNTGVEATSAAAFLGRIDHASVVFNNKMWVIGGYDGSSYRNDVWYSTDGVLWEQATEDAAFSPRKEHASVVFDNKLWVIGGAVEGNPTRLNDVWYSNDGISWTLATANTAFPAVSGHSSVVFENKLWVFGGSVDSSLFNNVWSSSDGIIWTQVTVDDTFPIREWHSSVVFDNKIWIIAGLSPSGYEKDVWNTSDGINWIQVSTDAEFSVRVEHTSVVFNNKIWVIGGFSGSCCSDAWYSENGVDWMQAIENSNFSDRHVHSSIVFEDKIWLIGGNNNEPGFLNDVWFLD